MADRAYTHARGEFARGNIDWVNDNIDALLVMTNTTIDTEDNGIEVLSDFSSLDEMVATNYARIDVPTRSVVDDFVAQRAKITCGSLIWNSVAPHLGTGVRQVQALLIFQNNGGAALDVPIFYIDSFGGSFNPGGNKQTFTIDVSGLALL